MFADGAERIAAVADQDRDVTRLPEVVGQNLLKVLLVFDDQDARHERSGRVLPSLSLSASVTSRWPGLGPLLGCYGS
jgi:hypothetical protein